MPLEPGGGGWGGFAAVGFAVGAALCGTQASGDLSGVTFDTSCPSGEVLVSLIEILRLAVRVFFVRLALLIPVLLILGACASNSHVDLPVTKTFTIKSWGNGAPRLFVDLPSTFELEESDAADFTVINLTDRKFNSTAGIYLGHHPSLASELPRTRVTCEVEGKVGHVPVKWLRWTENKANAFASETLVNGFFDPKAKEGVAELVIHIFLSGRATNQLTSLENSFRTLRPETGRR